MFFRSLSGRFLLLTIIFVMLAEVLIFVPSVARYRVMYLQEHLELAQLASLSLLASPDDLVSPELADELLDNAEVLNIVLRRDDMRELVLSKPMLIDVAESFDLRSSGLLEQIRDAMKVMFSGGNRIIRIIGTPVKGAGTDIEATLQESPLRAAMLAYGANVFWISALISAITATLLFLSVRLFIVRPISRVVANMIAWREAPDDPRRIILPAAGITELRRAETALQDLQTQLSAALRHRDRLATLGGAVARISHDLRNMLTTAQLLADRMESSNDPTVVRIAPKLISSIARAINLCENTLAFGKAEEMQPELCQVNITDLVADVFEADLSRNGQKVDLIADIDPAIEANADPDHMFRILMNLIRNARQAIESSGKDGEIRVSAADIAGGCEILIRDTGPGFSERARANLFKPFEGGARKGGTGLGLAIAVDLVRGHGGTLELTETSEKGTVFRIFLPG